ncbi:hypothetical protein WEB32_29795 [Streptomyces netropsis]|uniref:hypothetical protein n=1 Tax=Streptomyces netropsis TaxID=55404 RepID=UPI0030CE472A
MAFKQTREVRADVDGVTGRARAWTTERELGVISLAVPGDRVQMTPDDARALAAWLEEQARAEERKTLGARTTYTRKVWN